MTEVIEDQLRFLSGHLRNTRQAGHSTELLKGFDPDLARLRVGGEPEDRGTSIVVHNMDGAKALGISRNRAVSLHSLEKLRGRTGPVLFDNAALTELFDRAGARIYVLEKELKEAKQKLAEIHRILGQNYPTY